jgi:hypothetical protein
MIVEFNSGGANFIPVQQAGSRQTDSASANDNDSSVSFSSQSLQAALKASADPRPEKVAQATALASDANYPSDSDLNRMAGYFASRI